MGTATARSGRAACVELSGSSLLCFKVGARMEGDVSPITDRNWVKESHGVYWVNAFGTRAGAGPRGDKECVAKGDSRRGCTAAGLTAAVVGTEVDGEVGRCGALRCLAGKGSKATRAGRAHGGTDKEEGGWERCATADGGSSSSDDGTY